MADFQPSEQPDPALATAQLAAMKVAYDNSQRAERHAAAAAADAADTARGQQRPSAAAATAKLAEREADPEWRSRLLTGDAATRAEFDELMKAKSGGSYIDSIMDGTAAAETGSFHVTSARDPLTPAQAVDEVRHLRDAGLDDGTIREALEGKPIARAQHDEAQRFYRRLSSSPEWRARLFAGDADAKGAVLAMAIIDICGPAAA